MFKILHKTFVATLKPTSVKLFGETLLNLADFIEI